MEPGFDWALHMAGSLELIIPPPHTRTMRGMRTSAAPTPPGLKKNFGKLKNFGYPGLPSLRTKADLEEASGIQMGGH